MTIEHSKSMFGRNMESYFNYMLFNSKKGGLHTFDLSYAFEFMRLNIIRINWINFALGVKSGKLLSIMLRGRGVNKITTHHEINSVKKSPNSPSSPQSILVKGEHMLAAFPLDTQAKHKVWSNVRVQGCLSVFEETPFKPLSNDPLFLHLNLSTVSTNVVLVQDEAMPSSLFTMESNFWSLLKWIYQNYKVL